MRAKYLPLLVIVASSLFVGCASVPTADRAATDNAKLFKEPSSGKSGLYFYRDSIIGSALKKDIWVDGQCLGETAPKMFFFTEVDGDKDHVLSTESEFSPNDLKLSTKSGMNYYIRQYIKMGVFVGGANFEIVDAAKGQSSIKNLKMGVPGKCSKAAYTK